MEVTPGMLTTKLRGLQETELDALITSFVKPDVDPWISVPRNAAFGDKVNAFVYWALKAGVVKDAYQETPYVQDRVREYFDIILPGHLEEVGSVAKVGKLQKTFVEPVAEVREQKGINPLLVDPDLDDGQPQIELEGMLYKPREEFTHEAEHAPNIRERIRSLRRVVLLGEPGAGKTFLLARLALDYAEEYANTGILPIFVPLSKYDGREPFATFGKARLGSLANGFDQLEVVWLLDALNEMPRENEQWERLRAFLDGLVRQNARFVLTCRVRNYEQELAYVPELYRVDLQELNPEQIHRILTCYLGADVDRIWQELLNGEPLQRAWEAWQGNVRDFWNPDNAWRDWGDHVRARKAVHADPRKLMLLCRSPFTLVQLLIPRFRWAMRRAQETGAALGMLLERVLPNNRVALFQAILEQMLKAESDRQHWPTGEMEAVWRTLGTTACRIQATEQRTVMSISDLPAQDGTVERLKRARDAGLVRLSDESIGFTHQLFQEYFATSLLHDLLQAYDRRFPDWELGNALPRRDEQLVELFPRWWDVGGWGVTVALLGELEGRDGMDRVVRWLASYAPEIALRCVLDNNDGFQVSHLGSKGRDALISGALTRCQEVDPVGRAAAFRVLGHREIDWDRRPGIGNVNRNVSHNVNRKEIVLPDIEWGEPVLPGEYPIGGGDAYQALPAQRVTLSYAYKLAKYPITQAQFQCFMDAEDGYNAPIHWTEAGLEWKGKRRSPDEVPSDFAYANHPRVYVCWYEAYAFCSWLTARYRALGLIGGEERISLPTQVEWEIGACGKAGLEYPYGNVFDATKGNTYKTGIGRTSAVGMFPDGSSPYGVLDMSGNVWEWCLSGYEDGSNDPAGSFRRVLRGGSWFDFDGYARARVRDYSYPSHGDYYIGFRVVFLPHSIGRL